jgi:HlyD family secretion protein
MKSFLKKIGGFAIAHKVWTAVIVVVIIGIGYGIYHYTRPAALPQYIIARARIGNIVQTVTGSGQVSAANQLDVASQVSGTIESIDVSVGQHVHAGDLIATIDPTNALNTLNNAKISMAKLTEGPKATDLSNAQNSVTQSYGTAFNAISNSFIDLQTVMPGLNTLLYGQGTFLSDQESSYLNSTSRTDRLQTGMSYDAANIQYTAVLTEYKALTRQSATSTIAQVLADTYALSKSVANALQNTQNTITFITKYQPDYLAKDASTAASEVVVWSNSINGDISSILSAQNGIASAENSLTNLVVGANTLDIQSQQLSLQQAEQTYSNYFIRAPFDGVIGRIPVSVYGQAGGSTVIATVIGNQKIATLSLNEVDAATVKKGNPASLTFDAINNFTATGTIAEVDLVGTVSSGVVSYGLKVAIDTADSRINPGMSVNATITTNEIDNVLVVPSAAVKTQGNNNYVQIMDPSFASSTAGFASTTRSFNAGTFGASRSASVTISSATTPTNQPVTIGTSDGTNTQILTGLTSGAWVVTKTVAGTSQTTTAAPSLLSSFGAGNRSGGGTIRAAGGATGAAAATRPTGN